MVLGATRLGLILLSACSLGQAAKEVNSVVNSPAKMITNMQLEMSLNYNWPQLVMSAPVSIDLLGQINILASKTPDFQLDEPRNGFKYLNHRSFKSALGEISERGWQAFRKAHNSMDEIATRTADMPHNLATLLKLVASKNLEDIQTYGPIYLDSVKLGMQACRTSAQQTVERFNDMNLVVSEIIQTATSTKLSGELNLTEITIQKQVKDLEKADLEVRQKRLKLDIAESRKSIKKWEGRYTKSLDNFPSGWTQLGMSFCESLVTIATFGLSKATNKAARIMDKDLPKKPEPSFATCITSSRFPPQQPLSGLEKAKLGIVAQMEQPIIKAIEDFKSTNNPTDLNIDQGVYAPPLTLANAYKDAINSAGVQKGTSGPFMHVLEKLIAIINDAKQAVVGNKGAGRYAEFKSRLEAVQKPAICLSAMATELINKPQLARRQLPTNKDISSGSVAESHIKNAKMLLDREEERLKHFEEKFELQQKDAVKIDAALLKAMSKIKRLGTDIVSTEKMLKVLKDALALLGKLKSEWQKLTRFFDKIEVAINAALGPKVDTVTKFFDRTLESKKMFTKALGNILFDDIMKVVAESLVIKRVATKYRTLSGQHLMPMVELAGQFVTIHDDAVQTRKMERELSNMVVNANDYLNDLLAKENIMFRNVINKRKEELRSSMAPLIGMLDNNSKREIAEAVNTGMETAVAIREKAVEPDPVEELVNGTFSPEKAIADLQFEDENIDDGLGFDF